jgi:hypothetical protein
MAVTMKNVVFWDVTQSGSVLPDVSEERIASIIRVTRIRALRTMLAVTSNRKAGWEEILWNKFPVVVILL